MTMPNEFYRTGNYKVDHTTFGGLICQSDFNTDYSGNTNANGSVVAAKIASDWRFDESCKEGKSTIAYWRKTNGNKE